MKNKATGEIVSTYRGSDTDNRGIDWWGQDATIWTQTPGAQENEARKFVEAVKKNPEAKNSSIVLTGHSLGGFHAPNWQLKKPVYQLLLLMHQG